MSEFIWKPWDEFKEQEDQRANVAKLPIDEPPCKHCRFWFPVLEFDLHYGYPHTTGVKCCHSEDMFDDFSCYRARRETLGESDK